LLSERGFSKAIGIKRSGSHWQRRKTDEEGGAQLPVFISANNLKPFIGNELAAALSNPIKYRMKHGSDARGSPASNTELGHYRHGRVIDAGAAAREDQEE
jgi:hypothetical protein